MTHDKPLTSWARQLVRWGLYPASWAVLLFGFYQILNMWHDPQTIWGITVGGLAIVYLLIEFAFPYERRWAMTWASFLTDIRYVVVNFAGVTAMSVLLALFTITIAGDLEGPARLWPLWLQLVCLLLIFEAANYGLHRAMHELPGTLGTWLWNVHAAHHLPARLYLIMHAVFHPINGAIIQTFTMTLPIWLLGFDQRVVTMFYMINGMHGLISHFNVDIRMGWANYLFVGPELHRYHHSADVTEAMNYGATLTTFDQIFGTFVYRPGQPPQNLGVAPEAGLPPYEEIGKVLKLPFGRAR